MPSPSDDLAGRRALVTAGSRGIGRAVAAELVARGARVVITGTGPAVAETAQDLGAAGSVVADFTRPGDAARAASEAQDLLGGVDLLVVNTGGPRPAAFAELDAGDWLSAYHLILGSAIELAGACLPAMRAAGFGRMVFLTSTAGVVKPLPRLHLSNVMRAGVAALAQTIALEAGPDGVTTHVVATGPTDTPRRRQIVAAQAQAAGEPVEVVSERELARVPLRRMGAPEELAGLVAFLCSAPAGFMTGATHVVDGGLTLT